jgi:hypothetical protein
MGPAGIAGAPAELTPVSARWRQRLLLHGIAWLSRPGLAHRSQALPESGRALHVTSVLRLPAVAVPELPVPARHHRYPPETIHVTVANLDRARATIDDGIEALRSVPLPRVRFTLAGLGTSPDTIFIRCLFGPEFVRLRRAVAEAFDLPPRRSPLGFPYRHSAHANVVRFDGRGAWVSERRPAGAVSCAALEIVRTDRFLSGVGTEILATLPLS